MSLADYIDCEVHTTWQSSPRMRWVLLAVRGDRALLWTRRSNKYLETDAGTVYPVARAKVRVAWHQTNRHRDKVAEFMGEKE